ncbi:hypothetical protein DFP72DRAFT_584703, partial [Ephemerocybe angulata]
MDRICLPAVLLDRLESMEDRVDQDQVPLEQRINQGPLTARIRRSCSISPMPAEVLRDEQTASPLRPSKKPRLLSRMSDDGIFTRDSPSDVCSPSSTSMGIIPSRNETSGNEVSKTSWTKSKKRRESRKRQLARAKESRKHSLTDQTLVSAIQGRDLLSRIEMDYPAAREEGDDQFLPMGNLTPQSAEVKEFEFDGSSCHGLPRTTNSLLTPLTPPASEIRNSSVSSSSMSPGPSPTLSFPQQLPAASPKPSGDTSSRAKPSTSIPCSGTCTSAKLLSRTLHVWGNTKSLLFPPKDQPKSPTPPNGLPLGTLHPMPTSSSSNIEGTSCASTETKSVECSPPDFPSLPLVSSPMMRQSGSLSRVQPPCDSRISTASTTSPMPTSLTTELKPKGEKGKGRSQVMEEVLVEMEEPQGSATGITRRAAAKGLMESVGSGTSAENVESRDMERPHAKEQEARRRNYVPKYMRYNDWGLPEPIRAVEWTEFASPLPSPPPSVVEDVRAAQTIANYPHLFEIVTPIHVDVFEQSLLSHPNRPFCDSVVHSLRDGFWPFASIPDDYPIIYEAPQPNIDDEDQIRFLRDQRDIELSRGRYSKGFSTLLEGMARMPNFAVPKDDGSTWRQVVNHSYGPHALNLMVDKDAMGKAPLDGMRSFGPTLVDFRRRFPNARLILWKADVREAYRLIPMHRFWQIKQVEFVDGLNYVNRCNVFGGTASQILFIAFMALVNWIAVYVYAIPAIAEYSDDHFGVACEDDVDWYEPYQKMLPTPQAQLLRVWDRLGVPHKESKQVSGNPLTIIGISVDTTTMTLSLPEVAKTDLLAELDLWCDEAGQFARKGASLKRWQQLAGWMNWAFNVFPLLRPCLAN